MIILMGPSASGKTAVGRVLERKYNIKKVVTYTTREPRIGEVDGIDYHFLSKEEFLAKKENGFFFESICYNQNYYGTSFESLKNDRYLILDIDGYYSYKKSGLPIDAFFFSTTKETRKIRMINRKDDLEVIKQRLLLDDQKFDESKLDNLVNIIDVNKLGVDEVAEKVYAIYRNKYGI